MVDIQSDIFDKLPTRLVIPLLARRANMPTAMPRSLCPSIGWNGSALVALPHLAAPYRISDRGVAQGNLRPQAGDFTAALDAVISGLRVGRTALNDASMGATNSRVQRSHRGRRRAPTPCPLKRVATSRKAGSAKSAAFEEERTAAGEPLWPVS